MHLSYGYTDVELQKQIDAGKVAGPRLILHRDKDLGSVEKGTYADIIATDGDPLRDITEIQNVKFVMKNGQVIKNDLAPKPGANQTASAR